MTAPAPTRPFVGRTLGLVGVALALLAGCGSQGKRPAATLVLDFTPNAIHSGLYTTVARGYDRAAGFDLRIEQPSESTDSVKLLLSGRTRFAVLDIHDLALAQARDQEIVGVMALVQRPLAAVIAQPAFKSPRELERRKVGVTGLASDVAVLDSVVAGAGGDPRKVKAINIGFEAVPSLLTRRVDAATAFWDVEGVALTSARPGIKEFRVDEYGAPAYPELVLCVTRSEVEHEHAFVEKVVHAIERGYALTVSAPAASAEDLLHEVPGLNRSTIAAQLRALRGAFVAAGGRFGELNLARLRSWASWEAHFGIVRRPPRVSQLFDPGFAG